MGYKSLKKEVYPSLKRLSEASKNDASSKQSSENLNEKSFDHIDVPAVLISDCIKFYRTFLQPSSKKALLLSDPVRIKLDDDLLASGMLKFKSSIFDDAISEILLQMKIMYLNMYVNRYGDQEETADNDEGSLYSAPLPTNSTNVQAALFVKIMEKGRSTFSTHCENTDAAQLFLFINACLLLESKAQEYRIVSGLISKITDLPSICRFNNRMSDTPQPLDLDSFIVPKILIPSYADIYDTFIHKNITFIENVDENIIDKVKIQMEFFEGITPLCIIASDLDLQAVDESMRGSELMIHQVGRKKVESQVDKTSDLRSYIYAKNASSKNPMSTIYDDLIDVKLDMLFNLHYKPFYALTNGMNSKSITDMTTMKDLTGGSEERFIELILLLNDEFKLHCAVSSFILLIIKGYLFN